MNKLLETLISLFKMLVVTLIVVAGFIGFGRIINWVKNRFIGVHEDKATEIGLKILAWWLLAFITLFVVAMVSDEYSHTYELITQLAAYWMMVGLIIWFIGLFGYALNDISEDAKVDAKAHP